MYAHMLLFHSKTLRCILLTQTASPNQTHSHPQKKACYADFNCAFLSAVAITFVDKSTSIVIWPTFGSATHVHISATDTSGSEKVIAIASQGNQSWLLVTAQWKAATSSLCLLCSRPEMATPSFSMQQERGIKAQLSRICQVINPI